MNDVKRYETWETGNKQVVTVAADHPLSLIIEALQAENKELKSSFDSLAAAVGWTEARCEQPGDSPHDCADNLMRSLSQLEMVYGWNLQDAAELVSTINKLKADAVREACEIAASCLSRTDTAEMMHDAIISYADSLDVTKLEAGE